jgi:hypothetical protein
LGTSLANATCRAASGNVEVKLGGVHKFVSPEHDLFDGQHATIPCSDVNPLYEYGYVEMTCIEGYIHVSMTACKIHNGPSTEQCKEEKEYLEEYFDEAVKAITEEMNEVEAEIKSTACEDTAHQAHQQKSVPLQESQGDLTAKLTSLTESLTSFRDRIETAVDTETSLRNEISDIAKRCDTTDKTIFIIEKVRNAIHVLDQCPGLGHLEFTLPEWVGKWVVLDIASDNHDAQTDAEMYVMCRSLATTGVSPRPAETSEIQQSAIKNAPETNTAHVPLLGACPGCEGISDDESGVPHPSGHARICWDPDSTLNADERREDCGHGRKAIMCVFDKSVAPFQEQLG